MSHLIESPEEARALLRASARIAILGIKPETHSSEAAHYVPAFLQGRGVEVVPVPVYYPEVTEILGEKVYRKLIDIPDEVDMINVFRRPQDIPQHVDDIIEKKPRSVWFQLGIVNDEAAERIANAGIKVVQNKCLMVEHRYL